MTRLLLVGPRHPDTEAAALLAKDVGFDVHVSPTWPRSTAESSALLVTQPALDDLAPSADVDLDGEAPDHDSISPSQARPGLVIAWCLDPGAAPPFPPDVTVHGGESKDERRCLLQWAYRYATLQEDRAAAERWLARRLRARNTYRRVLSRLLITRDASRAQQLTAQATMEVLSADAASILLLEDAEGQLRFAAAAGRLSGALIGVTVDVEHSVAGWVTRHGRPLALEDAYDDGRFNPSIDQVTGLRTGAVACVPIVRGEEVIGALEAINPQGRAAFSEEDLRYLGLLAAHVGLALENIDLSTRLEQLSATDPLTGLYTGRYLYDLLDAEVERCGRYGGSVSLVFADIDQFKHVNDRFGHLIGRRLLREVGRVIQGALRDFDVPARYGGDEFLIVLPRTDAAEAYKLTEGVRHAIAKAVFFQEGTYSVRLTSSFGIATYPDHADSARALVNAAGRAMYRAKASQRNCSVLAPPLRDKASRSTPPEPQFIRRDADGGHPDDETS